MSGFVIDVCDPVTGEIADQIRIAESLRMTLASEFDVIEIAKGASYEIDSELMSRLAVLLGIDGLDGRAGRIRGAKWFDELPYRLHTGRELSMMLRGEKPLAVFVDDMPDVEDNGIVPIRIFAPHVASGVIVRRDRLHVMDGVTCRDVLYAIAAEAWRIDAHLLLIDITRRDGWSDSLERMQGRLLGYSDEQNDAYIKAISKWRNEAQARL